MLRSDEYEQAKTAAGQLAGELQLVCVGCSAYC